MVNNKNNSRYIHTAIKIIVFIISWTILFNIIDYFAYTYFGISVYCLEVSKALNFRRGNCIEPGILLNKVYPGVLFVLLFVVLLVFYKTDFKVKKLVNKTK